MEFFILYNFICCIRGFRKTFRSISALYSIQSNAGIAEVILDGKSECTVDLYNPVTVYQQIVFQKTHLDRGNHTIQIRVTGNKSAVSSGANVVIDSFKVIDSSDITPPVAPSALKVVNLTKSVELFWGANTDNDFEGYNIYRSTNPLSGFQKINQCLYFNEAASQIHQLLMVLLTITILLLLILLETNHCLQLRQQRCLHSIPAAMRKMVRE